MEHREEIGFGVRYFPFSSTDRLAPDFKTEGICPTFSLSQSKVASADNAIEALGEQAALLRNTREIGALSAGLRVMES